MEDQSEYPADWWSARVYERCKNSVVSVRAFDTASAVGTSTRYSQGTGFFIKSSNTIVTDLHCVRTQNIGVTASDGKFYKATVLATDKTRDLAFLRINAPAANYRPLPFASHSMPYAVESENFSILGFPKKSKKLFLSAGRITETLASVDALPINKISADFRRSDNVYMMDARIESGLSGSPVLNEKCEVVGIVEAGEGDIAVMRPIEQLAETAAALKVK